MKLRILFYAIFSMALLTSCETEDSDDDIDYSKEVIFNISDFNEVNDGVQIEWNLLKNRDFISYDIIRYSSFHEVKNISLNYISEKGIKIATITDINENSYIDNDINNGNVFFYYILSVNYTDENDLKTLKISDDYKTHIRKELLINLNNIEYSENGENINIDWGNSVTSSFINFELYRFETNYLPEFDVDYVVENGTKIGTLTNQNSFIDTNLNSDKKFIIYAIKINTNEFSYYTQNYLYVQNNLFFDFRIQKIILNPEKPETLLLLENSLNTIHEYSLSERKILNTITLNTQINEPYISDGELYLPCMDGNIYIYDAKLFTPIDLINLSSDNFIHSLVKKNDIIFYTESYNLNYGYFIGRAINRITKEEVTINDTTNGYYYNNNPVKFIDGKNDYFLAIKSIHNFSVTDIVYIEELSSHEVNLSDTFDGSVYEDIGYEIFDITNDYSSFISSEKAYHYTINYDIIHDGESLENRRFAVLGSYGNSSGNYLDILVDNSDVLLATQNNQIKIYKLEEFNLPHTVINTKDTPEKIIKISDILIVIENTQSNESRLELINLNK